MPPTVAQKSPVSLLCAPERQRWKDSESATARKSATSAHIAQRRRCGKCGSAPRPQSRKAPCGFRLAHGSTRTRCTGIQSVKAADSKRKPQLNCARRKRAMSLSAWRTRCGSSRSPCSDGCLGGEPALRSSALELPERPEILLWASERPDTLSQVLLGRETPRASATASLRCSSSSGACTDMPSRCSCIPQRTRSTGRDRRRNLTSWAAE
mmetsp:Transcript_2333/g.6945  ORF Transcript_2333/g.6945 Transcript_2333/m.6945 type:complete len:210 (+) Transcript_2333:1549-2178(+)